MDKVKNCPFCGGDNVAIIPYRWFVRCENSSCGAEGPYRDTVAEAIEAWNKRVERPGTLYKEIQAKHDVLRGRLAALLPEYGTGNLRPFPWDDKVRQILNMDGENNERE